jgi:hypothetical protein
VPTWATGETAVLRFTAHQLADDAHAYADVLRGVHAATPRSDDPGWVSVEEAAELAAWGLDRWHYRPDPPRLLEAVAYDLEEHGTRDAMHVSWVSGVPYAYALLLRAASPMRSTSRRRRASSSTAAATTRRSRPPTRSSRVIGGLARQRLAAANSTDGRIASIDTESSPREAAVFVDAGYEGDLPAAAAVPYAVVRLPCLPDGRPENRLPFAPPPGYDPSRFELRRLLAAAGAGLEATDLLGWSRR